MASPNRTPQDLDLHFAEEDAAYVLAFLKVARPLAGCAYTDDHRFSRGKDLVRRLAGSLLCPQSTAQSTVKDLSECADVLYFLHNIEPVSGATFSDGDAIAAGLCLVLTWVETKVAAASTAIERAPRRAQAVAA